MKIAIASMDGSALSPHFGRSRCFIVFEAKDGKISGREVRDNRYTAHAAGECTGEAHHGESAHSHAGVVAALADCGALICGGMGARAAADLKASGVVPVVAPADWSAEQAAQAFLDGTLPPPAGFCRCHH
jgi:predicted Fe-Mo cluster-binding NifX family protein